MISDYLNSTHIEQDAIALDGLYSNEVVLAASSAISLKRIADLLAGPEGLSALFTQPVNNYGESLTDAIQMAFVRGHRGIDRT